jgi:hypothetical protein
MVPRGQWSDPLRHLAHPKERKPLTLELHASVLIVWRLRGFGYSGRYITARFPRRGASCCTTPTGCVGLQTIFVDDLAKLVVPEGHGGDQRIVATIGPETFAFRELVSVSGEIMEGR